MDCWLWLSAVGLVEIHSLGYRDINYIRLYLSFERIRWMPESVVSRWWNLPLFLWADGEPERLQRLSGLLASLLCLLPVWRWGKAVKAALLPLFWSIMFLKSSFLLRVLCIFSQSMCVKLPCVPSHDTTFPAVNSSHQDQRHQRLLCTVPDNSIKGSKIQ